MPKDQWLFGCTDDGFEGMNYINEKGILYYWEHDMGGNARKPYPIASSMDKYIEKEAVRRSFFYANSLRGSSYPLRMQDVDWDDLVIKWRLVWDEDASDAISQMWFNDHLCAEVTNSHIRCWKQSST